VKVIALYKLLLVVLLSVALPVAAAPPLGRDNMPAWRYFTPTIVSMSLFQKAYTVTR
jgi:hypothetical protein